MAEFEDINQNINLKYTTNADDTAKEVVKLDEAQESVTRSTVANTKATKENDTAYKSFKQQIREAQQEQLKMAQMYGLTSKESVEATKKLAKLKDEMADAKSLTDGFNPDRKFQSMATAVNAAAVAASGITSGMALFGAESAETEKALLKVQAAMAFSDAVGRITEMGDDFMKLKAQVISTYTSLTTSKTADTLATGVNTVANEANTVATNQGFIARAKTVAITTAQTVATGIATAAQWAWNVAMNANPIGLLVIAITALIAGAYFLIKAFQDSADASAKAETANKKLNKELDDLAKSTAKANAETKFHADAQIAMAKASGKSTEEIRKLKEELINQEVAEKRLNAVKAQSIFLEARRVAGLEDATDAQKETSKKAYEEFKNQNETYNQSLQARKQLAVDHRVEIVAEEVQKNKELADKQKEAQKKAEDERRQAYEKELADRKKLKDDLANLENKYLTDLQNINDKSEQDKLDRQKERDLAEIEILRKRGANVENLIRYNDEKYKTLQFELDEKTRLEKEEKDKELAEKKKEADQKYWEEQADLSIKRTEKDAQRDKILLEQKQKNNDDILATGDALIAGAKLLGEKNKGLQKAVILTESAVSLGKVGINIATGVSKDAASGAVASIPQIAKTLATGVFAAGSIVLNTKKALAGLGGGGGSPSGSEQSQNTGGTPQVGFQSSTENQIATTVSNSNKAMEPIKAFVVSNEVTTAQSLDRNKIEANSI